MPQGFSHPTLGNPNGADFLKPANCLDLLTAYFLVPIRPVRKTILQQVRTGKVGRCKQPTPCARPKNSDSPHDSYPNARSDATPRYATFNCGFEHYLTPIRGERLQILQLHLSLRSQPM
ncbi:hypothetical protein J6590_030977 [Homalodisca vitripennis]|nr:hypothetical protein J6590_030977 [Homalodisca vitripennis]